MNIDIDTLLQYVQDLRSQLETWGVNSDTLLALGAVAAILFFFSLREVASWYFRVNQVRDEVRSLRAQMAAMQKSMTELIETTIQKEPTAPPLGRDELLKIAEGMRNETSAKSTFRFDH